jgi:predicted nucleic acid-binding protein
LLLADQIIADGARLTTTRAVIVEIGNFMAKRRHRQAAVRLLSSFEIDSEIEIVPDSEDLHARAFALYRARPDKEWGMTDCISFIVMQDAGLTVALTTDEHLEQAGFVKLL